jgi:ParB family chromosome partitioning protein
MAVKQKHGLGRGLSALIKDGAAPQVDAVPGDAIHKVAIADIKKNTRQPRHTFDKNALEELTASVRERGVLQPLLVRKDEEGYELIAGERRLRAATEAGLTEVPVVVIRAGDKDSLELALIENIQRQDLGVMEEAEGYRSLADDFGLTQDEIAEQVGKARATVANALRLLSLPEDVKELIRRRQLSAGHAKLLTGLDNSQEQRLFAERTVRESLSVRNLEKAIQKSRRTPRKPRAARNDIPTDHLRYISDKLHGYFGTSVRVHPSRTYANGKKGRGSIEIEFYSNEDLDRILGLLGLEEE